MRTCTRLTQRWCAKNFPCDNPWLLAQDQDCTYGENQKQYSTLSMTKKIPPRKIGMKSHYLSPQECKEIEWLNLLTLTQKFQQMKTNPRFPNTRKFSVHTCLFKQVLIELPCMTEGSILQDVVRLEFSLPSNVEVGVIRRLLFLLCWMPFWRL